MRSALQEERPHVTADPKDLMAQYKKTGDLELRNELILHYLDSVKKSVMSMRSILPPNLQYDDFINEGVLALVDCIEKFDPTRNASFETYVYKRLRGSVLSYMRKQSWLPYRVRTAKRSIQTGQETLRAQLGREPTEEELAQFLDMPEKKLDKYMLEISNAEMYSFEELVENASQMVSDLPEDVGSRRESAPEAQLLQRELRLILQGAIEELPKREREVITLCYYENLNLREISEVLGVSQQRASCARSSGLQKLNKKLKDYMDGRE